MPADTRMAVPEAAPPPAYGGEPATPSPQLSVVVPVYNEEDGLPALFARIYPALDALGVPYELIFVNDGSRDRSAALLRAQWQARPDVTRVVLFNANFGQHTAIIAGFERCRGERVVTLDADLQNPPEEIGKLLAAMDRVTTTSAACGARARTRGGGASRRGR